MALDRSN